MNAGRAGIVESETGAPMRKKRGVPEDIWVRCAECSATLFRKHYEQADRVCPECDHHGYVPAQARIEQLLDTGSFEEWYAEISPVDPLSFADKKPYLDRLRAEQEKTGLREACIVGRGYMRGRPLVMSVQTRVVTGRSRAV